MTPSRRVEVVPRTPWWGLASLIGAAILAMLAFLQLSLHCALAAVPFLIAGAIWIMGREKPWAMELTKDSLQIEEPPASIPWSDLQGLVALTSRDPAEAAGKPFRMRLFYRDGILEIPAHLSIASDKLYRVFYRRFSPSGDRSVNPRLTAYLSEQIETFGEEKVFSYRARAHLGNTLVRRERLIAYFFLLTGCVWLPWVVRGQAYAGWTVFGVLLLVAGLLVWLMSGLRSMHRTPIQNWRDASLIVSPLGLAMIQGDLQGELRWAELRRIRYLPRRRRSAGIVLNVEGATLSIANIYDRPLALIYDRILHYWKPRGAAS